MIIDFHTHVFSEEIKQNREKYLKDSGFSLLYSNPESKIITGDELLKEMDQQGVDLSVVMGFSWQSKDICDMENEYLLEVMNRNRDRIIPMAGIPNDYRVDITRYITTLREKGFYALGEIGFYSEKSSKRMESHLRAIFKGASENKMLLSIHVNEPVGHIYDGKYDTSFRLLYDLIGEYPETEVVLSHWGGGILFYELMPEVKKRFKNVYYDIAASPYLYDKKIYTIIEKLQIEDKILFGSDYPLLKPERYFKEMENTLAGEIIKKIKGQNSKSLLEKISGKSIKPVKFT